MQQAKRILDPDNLLNPGVLVDPAPFDSDLRLADAPAPTAYDAAADPRRRVVLRGRAPLHRRGEVHRRQHWRRAAVMCPSYVVTREEKDSTRGRARVLQDVATGVLGFDDPAVDDALDLCLSCKGCARDCPTGIDMATYKSEALSQKYAGPRGFLRRPRSHYALGQLPRWARMTPPKLANTMLRSKTVGRVAKSAAGVDQRRSLPRFSARPLRAARQAAGGERRRLDLGRLVHRPLRRGHRPGGGPAAGDQRPAGGGDPGARVLRPDLDHHRPAHRRATDRRPGRRDAARLRRERHPGHRPRAELPRIDPGGRRPAASTTPAPPR